MAAWGVFLFQPTSEPNRPNSWFRRCCHFTPYIFHGLSLRKKWICNNFQSKSKCFQKLHAMIGSIWKKFWIKLSVCDGADRQSEFKEVGRDMSPLFFSSYIHRMLLTFTLYTDHTEEYVQYFLIKLGIKPLMHQLEISTFSPNNVTVRLNKIMNRADKNQTHF